MAMELQTCVCNAKPVDACWVLPVPTLWQHADDNVRLRQKVDCVQIQSMEASTAGIRD